MFFYEVDEEIRRVFKYSTVREAEKFLVNLDNDVIESRSTLKKLIKGSYNDLIDLCDKLNGIDRTCEEIAQIHDNMNTDVNVLRQPMKQEQIEEKSQKYEIQNAAKENYSQNKNVHLLDSYLNQTQKNNQILMENNSTLSIFVSKIQESLVEVDVALQCHELVEAANKLFELQRKLYSEEKIYLKQNTRLPEKTSTTTETVQNVNFYKLHETIALYAEQIEKAVLDKMLSSSAILTDCNLQEWLKNVQQSQINIGVTNNNNTNKIDILTGKFNQSKTHSTEEFMHHLHLSTLSSKKQVWEYVANTWSECMEIISLTSKCENNKCSKPKKGVLEQQAKEITSENNQKIDYSKTDMVISDYHSTLKQEGTTPLSSLESLLERLRLYIGSGTSVTNNKALFVGYIDTYEEDKESENNEVDSFLFVIAKLLLRIMTSISSNVNENNVPINKQKSTEENETVNKVDYSVHSNEYANGDFANSFADFFCELLHQAHKLQFHVNNKKPHQTFLLSEHNESDLSELHESLASSSTISSLYGIMHIHVIVKLTEHVINNWCKWNQSQQQEEKEESNFSNLFQTTHKAQHKMNTKPKEGVWATLLRQEQERQTPTLFNHHSDLTQNKVSSNTSQIDMERQELYLTSTNRSTRQANKLSLHDDNSVSTCVESTNNNEDNLLWQVHCAIHTEIDNKHNHNNNNIAKRTQSKKEEILQLSTTIKQTHSNKHNVCVIIKSGVEEFVSNFAIPCQTYLLTHYANHPLLLFTLALQYEHNLRLIDAMEVQEKKQQNRDPESNLKPTEERKSKTNMNEHVISIDTHLGERLKAQLLTCIINAFDQASVLLDVFVSQLTSFAENDIQVIKYKTNSTEELYHQEKEHVELNKTSVEEKEIQKVVLKHNELHEVENQEGQVYESTTLKRIKARRAWLLNEKTTLPSIKELQQFISEIGQIRIMNNPVKINTKEVIHQESENVKEREKETSIQSNMDKPVTDEQLIYAMAKYDNLQRAINNLIESSEETSNKNKNNSNQNEEEENEENNTDSDVHLSSKRTILNELMSFAEAEQGQLYSSRYFGVNDLFFSRYFTNWLNPKEQHLCDENVKKDAEINAQVQIHNGKAENAKACNIIKHVKRFMNARFIRNDNNYNTIWERCTLDDLKFSLVVLLLQIHNVLSSIHLTLSQDNNVNNDDDDDDDDDDDVNQWNVQRHTTINISEMYREVMNVFRTFASKWSFQFEEYVNTHSFIHEQEESNETSNNETKEQKGNAYDNEINYKLNDESQSSRLVYTKIVWYASTLHHLSPVITLLKHILNCFIHPENDNMNCNELYHKEKESLKDHSANSHDIASHSCIQIKQKLTKSLHVCHDVWMQSILIKEFTWQLDRLFVESIRHLQEFVIRYGTNRFITHQFDKTKNKVNNNNREMSSRDVREFVELFYSDRIRSYTIHKKSINTSLPNVTSTRTNEVNTLSTEGNKFKRELEQEEETPEQLQEMKKNDESEGELGETYRVLYKPTPELLFLLLDLRTAILFLTDGHVTEDSINNATCINNDVNEDSYRRNAIFYNLPSTIHIPLSQEIMNMVYDRLERKVVEHVENNVLPTITQILCSLHVAAVGEENTQTSYHENDYNRSRTSEHSNNEKSNSKSTMSFTRPSVFCFVYEQLYFDLCVLHRAFAQSDYTQSTESNKELQSKSTAKSKMHHLLHQRIAKLFMHSNNNNENQQEYKSSKEAHQSVEVIQRVIEQEVCTLVDDSGVILGLRQFESESFEGQQPHEASNQSSLFHENANVVITKQEDVSKFTITPVSSTTSTTTMKSNPAREIPRFQLLPLPADTSMHSIRKR